MRLAWAGLVLAAACYHTPSSDPSCSIRCDSDCPSDMSCVAGFCVAAGETCAPTFTAVHAGGGFACALDDNSLLWCWGTNGHHQLDPGDAPLLASASQIGTERWDTIATGGSHICGLRNGALFCWGDNDRQQVSGTQIGDVTAPLAIDPPAGHTAWSYVAAGYEDTCAIADGALFCWGANENGQIGDGTTTDAALPTAVMTSVSDWFAVTAGPDHNCALSPTAGIQCWGNNTHGQLGNGMTTASPMPVTAAGPTGAVAIAVGLLSTCAIDDSSQLWCWGYAGNHALGDPAVIDPASGDKLAPTIASGLQGWTSVSAGEELACGQRGDEAWCWGLTRGGGGLGNGVWSSYGWGQIASGVTDLTLGWNENLDRSSASSTGSLSDLGDLDLGCEIIAGQLQCWGDDRYGQLGIGEATMQPTPVEIGGNHVWTSLAAGRGHMCGVAEGALYCWGANTSGQANGIPAGTQSVPCGSSPGLVCDVATPTALSFAPTASSIALGANHTCALDTGVATCWGDDSFGQLGGPGLTGPVMVTGTYDSLIAIAGYGQCALASGQTTCWGDVLDQSAQAPTQHSELDGHSHIGVEGILGMGKSVVCALDMTGQLVCDGDNTHGQFGNGVVTGTTCGNGLCDNGETCATCGDCGGCPFSTLMRTYEDLAVGWTSTASTTTQFACAIADDGHVECWGRNASGQTTSTATDYQYTPMAVAGLANCTAITASDAHACAICDGTVSCWGDNLHGGVGAGALTNTAVTVPRQPSLPLDAGDSWVQLVSGAGFTCARSANGHAFCWGLGTHGALGNGATARNLATPVLLEMP